LKSLLLSTKTVETAITNSFEKTHRKLGEQNMHESHS